VPKNTTLIEIATSHLHCVSNIDITIPVGIQKVFSTGFDPPWDSEHGYQFAADSPGEPRWAALLESYLHSTLSAGQHPELAVALIEEKRAMNGGFGISATILIHNGLRFLITICGALLL